MKYFYIVYCFSKDNGRISGQGSSFAAREKELNPIEIANWIKETNGFDSAVVVNWIEMSKEVFDKCVENSQEGKC